MKKNLYLLLLICAFCVLGTSPALADDEIWTKLADKASLIGAGLQRSGFIIAGLGLVVFSFMAIFNKISWKNLAYIMVSCFVLSGMVGLINYFSKKGDSHQWSMNDRAFSGPDASTSFKGGVAPAGGTAPK